MSKVEEAIEKLVGLAKESYQCEVIAHVDYFPESKREFIKIDNVSGNELFVMLFCAQFPDEIDGFSIYLSEAFIKKSRIGPLIN